MAVEKKAAGSPKTKAPFELTGTWVHKIPWIDGKDRTVVLTGKLDSMGKPYFEMDAPFFSYRAVFKEYSSKEGVVEILFKMVMYRDASKVAPHTLTYILRQNNGVWYGEFIESWNETHINITLQKR